MGVAGAVFLVLITILLPPVGVLIVAGCGPDFWINLCLTILGYIPGHIHAFYLEYCYYERKEGRVPPGTRAPGVYSDRITHANGPAAQGYGTIAQPTGPVQ